MYRQSPGRSQRSKGIKVKYVLQICLLLAVCFWLIYQVKHSHDKKKEFDESDAKALRQSKSDEIVKLGRKDIRRRDDAEITSKNEKQHDETIEEDETVEEEDIKHEEDEPEEKNVEEMEDHEQENSDAEVDREEELVNENETQEVDSEDGRGQSQSQTEGENSLDENERDGDDKSAHEAREENYKADDASSAVTHDAQTGANDNENGHSENPNERTDNVLEEENKENNNAEGGEIARDDQMSNDTTGETKVDLSDSSENSSPPNNTLVEGSNHDLTSNSSGEVKIENFDSSETKPELDHDSQAVGSERTNNSIVNAGATLFDSNSTEPAETKDIESHSEDLSSLSNNNNTESLSSEKVTTSEASGVVGNKTESSSEENEETGTGKSEYENPESTVIENHEEEFQHDGIDISDTSNSMDEKHVRTDLDTLPDIQTEGTNSDDDVAAE